MRSVPLAVVLVLLLNEASSACVVPRSILEERAHADSVFFGTVVAVGRRAELEGGGALDRAVTITFDVHRTVAGRPVEGVVEVYGFALGNFSPSIEDFAASYGRDVYVGIILPDTIEAHTKCGDENWTTGAGLQGATFRCKVDLPIFPDRYEPADAPRMDRARIIETVCGGSFIRKSLPRDLY